MLDNIFAIIVTYNGQYHIGRCLKSIKNQNIPISIIVVDNASTDKTLSMLHDFDDIHVIPLKKNLGFGRANNIGILNAYNQGGDYFLLLNQDAYLKPDCVSNLISQHKKNSEFGVLSPLHLNPNESGLDLHFADFIAHSRNAGKIIADLILEKSQKVYSIDCVNAAIWLLTRQCINKVGLFNPLFRHYGEDMEYADRVQYHKLKMGIISNVFAVHNRPQTNWSDKINNIQKEKLKLMGRFYIKLIRINSYYFYNISTVLKYLMGIRFKYKLLLGFNTIFRMIFRSFGIIKIRNIEKKGGKCFFGDARKDKDLFVYSIER